ncbi:MAG TPA: gamma-glutamyltransferase family protein [Ktedonobacterales bacterium]|nr:gamma-glutamyltransferase family protein [Ktedonobacterales bacterium]
MGLILDLDALAHPGKRQPVFAPHGVVATSQPLASQAGIDMLRRGGNAVDAALAAGIALTVVEPASNSIGGDTLAFVWDGERLHGLNGTGRAPAALTLEEMRRRGHEQMPLHHWSTVTVPGTPLVWRDLHERFGRLPFETLFIAAIEYAERGYPVPPISQRGWRNALERIHTGLTGDEFAELPVAFAPEGRAPHVGEVWRNPEMARTLRLIAETKADAFYRGEIAERMVDFAARTGGFLAADDLARHTSDWVEPITTSYRGYDVWEMPPRTQGLAVLLALNILEGWDLSQSPRDSVDSFHWQLEAMKLAFADAHHYVADPAHASIPVEELLSKSYAARRRALIGEHALLAEVGDPQGSDTIYLCAADGDGMMVSFIQSTFHAFGAHIVVPGTGFPLQNRGHGFPLSERHANRLAPGKRPFHTLIPGFLTHAGRAVGPFGVMGGHMQPQGHVQMMVNTLDYAMDPQSSLGAPRWSWRDGRLVKLESGAASLAGELRARGHEVEVDAEVDWAGRGQIIWRLSGETGGYIAGSEPRADGQAAGY